MLTLLSGCRPAALKEAKPEHIDFRRRVLHIAKPKGGAKRAFDIPLSREMMGCLVRALRYSRVLYPHLSREWVFPAESSSGHMSEQREERSELSKWGNDLRQSYRTLATVAGLSEIDAKLLMNHAIPGVNSGYITRHGSATGHFQCDLRYRHPANLEERGAFRLVGGRGRPPRDGSADTSIS